MHSKLSNARRRAKAWAFRILRPFVVRNIDPNEDFECMECGEPVLRRHLACSAKCWRALEAP